MLALGVAAGEGVAGYGESGGAVAVVSANAKEQVSNAAEVASAPTCIMRILKVPFLMPLLSMRLSS